MELAIIFSSFPLIHSSFPDITNDRMNTLTRVEHHQNLISGCSQYTRNGSIYAGHHIFAHASWWLVNVTISNVFFTSARIIFSSLSLVICRKILITVIQFRHQNEFSPHRIQVFIRLNWQQTANEWQNRIKGNNDGKTPYTWAKHSECLNR